MEPVRTLAQIEADIAQVKEELAQVFEVMMKVSKDYQRKQLER